MRPQNYQWAFDRKMLNENLNPLKGYLRSKVGQFWDRVYSDIRANLNMNKAIHLHIMEHLWHYVERSVIVEADGIYSPEYIWGRRRELKDDGHTFYVCPKTGQLKVPKKKASRYKWRKKINPNEKVFDGITHRKIKNIWYSFTRIEPNEYWSYRWRKHCPEIEEFIYFGKRQLNKKELRRLGLTNGM
jgi:hypothetical protein